MMGLYVTVPVAGFRKGLARDYWESHPLPPPSTCYGFLLALVGEEDRERHRGVRIAPALLTRPASSVVLRTAWRVKVRGSGLGNGPNRTPVEQELLTGSKLAIWLDSSQETHSPTLEQRVRVALDNPSKVDRFGGLSLGESSHLVDEVKLLASSEWQSQTIYLLSERGRISLPVWVDHVGSAGTHNIAGDLMEMAVAAPELRLMPMIAPR